MRLVYAGSPAIAVGPLRALRDGGFDVVAVFSQPARPVGRKRILTETPVAIAAREWGIPVFTPRSREELARDLRTVAPDLAIAVAYGRLIDEESLSIPTRGWWNVHFSLLPQWRGATPVQHSIRHGDEQTGITIFQMDTGLDTGPILSQVAFQSSNLDTAGAQLEKMADVGAQQLLVTLRDINSLVPTPQSGEASYAPKIPRPEGRIDWMASTATIDRLIRAVTPEPGAHTIVRGTGQPISVLRAFPSSEQCDLRPGEISVTSGRVTVGTQDGAMVIDRVVPSGKNEMAAADWLRGTGAGVEFES